MDLCTILSRSITQWITLPLSVRLSANKSIPSMRNIHKHPESNRTRLGLTLTCQVLTDCRSIRSLTRKASYCQGTARYERERERKRRWKSIKLVPSSPLNSRTGGWQPEPVFLGSWLYVCGVQSEQCPAEEGNYRQTWKIYKQSMDYIILVTKCCSRC